MSSSCCLCWSFNNPRPLHATWFVYHLFNYSYFTFNPIIANAGVQAYPSRAQTIVILLYIPFSISYTYHTLSIETLWKSLLPLRYTLLPWFIHSTTQLKWLQQSPNPMRTSPPRPMSDSIVSLVLLPLSALFGISAGRHSALISWRSAITRQIEHKLLKRGFQFNVMVVGMSISMSFVIDIGRINQC